MKKLLLTSILILPLLLPLSTSASTQITINSSYCTTCNLPYTPLEPIPGITTTSNGSTINFPQLLGNIFTVGITIGALLAVLMLTIGGIQYMVSEAVPNKAGGISRAKNALWAILLIACSWLILHTINPNLLNFNLNPCPQGSSGCTVVTAAPTSNSANACGSATNGCSVGTYCGQITSPSGSVSTSCLDNTNQSAQQNCSTIGGQWSVSGLNSNFCYLPQYTTPTSCQAAAQASGQAYQWSAPNLWGYYCNLPAS